MSLCRRGCFLIVKSGGYAGEMAGVNISEYEDDEAEDRKGLD